MNFTNTRNGMKKLLDNITSWIGWALVEASDRLGHASPNNEWEESPSLRNRVAGVLYTIGCELYGAFDNE